MRKLIAYILCCAVLFLSWPSFALADDSAKREFINSYLKYTFNGIKSQEAAMENLLNNNIKVVIDVKLSDGSMVMEDGTTMSNVSGSGKYAAVGSFKDLMAQAEFVLNLPSMPEIKGSLYLSPEEMILTSDLIQSLAAAGVEFDDLDVENLPPYMVFTNLFDEEDKALLKETFSRESLMSSYQKSAEIKTFMEILLGIIPESCFSYADGSVVLEIKPSVITSAALLHNLKANSEELAVSFTEIMVQPAYMSEEEFTSMKNDMISEFVEMIDSIQITDLEELKEIDSLFTDAKFKVSIKDQLVETVVHIGFEQDGESLDFAYESSCKIEADKLASQAKGRFSMNISSLDMVFVLQISSEDTAEKSTGNLTINGDIGDDELALKGVISADYDFDYKYDKEITRPEVNEGNSLIIDVTENRSGAQPTVEANGNEIYVFVDGWEIYFEQAQPMIIAGRTMLPVRELAEELGCTVTWLPPDTVVLSDGVREDMTLTINAPNYKIGDVSYPCEVPPQIIGDYTYVPVRLIAEYFGFTVEWYEPGRLVMLLSD